jgi:preprotein translocase subunit SecY
MTAASPQRSGLEVALLATAAALIAYRLGLMIPIPGLRRPLN